MTSSFDFNDHRPLILLVEDDYDTRRMMVRMLTEIGDVVSADNGEDALDQLVERRPDLVVTDVMMPKLDGLELSRMVKGDPSLARVPILMVTAKNLPRDIVDGINAGARSYITKPFSPDELLAAVRRALGR